jgi:hypothetical protein
MMHLKQFTRIFNMMRNNTGCDRIRYTPLKVYFDETNRTITTQFVIEHLFFFFECLICLPLLVQQTSRRYSSLSHNLFKKVTSERAVALSVLSWSSWRSTSMGGIWTLVTPGWAVHCDDSFINLNYFTKSVYYPVGFHSSIMYSTLAM